jgi:hypothetical protein
MNYFKQTMMDEPGDFTEDETSFKKERRVLVIALCLSYLACIAGLWFIGDVLGSSHDILGQQIGNGRFVLLVVPLAVLCVCYLRLRRIMGEIMELSGKKLDERQRLVRDQAHRTAYKIIAILCLGILLYFGIHSMLVAANPPAPATATIHTKAISHAVNVIVVSGTGNSHMSYAVLTKQAVGRISLSQTKDTLQWIVISSPFTSDVPRQIVAPTTPPIDLFGLGIYYSLFFLTVVLIVATLPKAIIAWKERG